jgi:hypothetical protein
MAWCENPQCGRRDLLKEQTEFDFDTKKLLCHYCYADQHPGWSPSIKVVDYSQPAQEVSNQARPGGVQYEISLSSSQGFRAKISYGDFVLGFHAPAEVLEKWRS